MRGHFFLKLSTNADCVEHTLRGNDFIGHGMPLLIYIYKKKVSIKWICTCSGVDKNEIKI